jgi:hypothetical protein
MKVTKRQLKQTIREEVGRALEEAGEGGLPWKNGGTTKTGAAEADPLEMLKRVKAMVDKAIADLETGGDLPGDASAEKEQVTRYPVTTKVDHDRPIN